VIVTRGLGKSAVLGAVVAAGLCLSGPAQPPVEPVVSAGGGIVRLHRQEDRRAAILAEDELLLQVVAAFVTSELT
jgi:hypothetical protein